ncbi:MAG TPA: SDR family oxidoreductase [Beijerinckiaceae bacterium]|nr:SDR family oxidoreductase [Beijerinckiaceae bacterium]
MKAALVTGGALRIGAAIVRRLAASGHAVAIHCNRSRNEAEALAAGINASGGRAMVVCGDLADPATSPRIVAEATHCFGSLTLLVNNAALFEGDSLTVFETDTFSRQIAVNLQAPLLLSRAFAEHACEGGAIINLIDQRVLKPTPYYLSYALTKEALWSATRILARSLAPRLRVNAVAPGPCLPNSADGPEVFAREVAAIPLQRAVSPDEIAEAVVFLAQAEGVTGQMIAVDGGQHLGWKTPDVLALEGASNQGDH